jgi:hypothetical protein
MWGGCPTHFCSAGQFSAGIANNIMPAKATPKASLTRASIKMTSASLKVFDAVVRRSDPLVVKIAPGVP